MKAKLYTEPLIKYFGNFFAKIWLINLYGEPPKIDIPIYYLIDTDTDEQLINDRQAFNAISKLCNDFGIVGCEVEFYTIFRFSHLIRIGLPSQNIKFEREVFSFFTAVIEIQDNNLKEVSFDMLIKTDIGNRLHSTNKRFLNVIKNNVFDLVAEYFERKKWNDVSNEEKIKLVKLANQYLIDTKPYPGHPNKKVTLKRFVTTIKKYIIETIPVKFSSGRELHLFIGKLTCLYGIIPEPDEYWKDREDKYFIKTIENLLPNNYLKNVK